MSTLAEERTHLRLRDLGAHDAEALGATTHPDTRRVAARCVVIGERLTRRAPLVGGGDLPGEVRVPSPAESLWTVIMVATTPVAAHPSEDGFSACRAIYVR